MGTQVFTVHPVVYNCIKTHSVAADQTSSHINDRRTKTSESSLLPSLACNLPQNLQVALHCISILETTISRVLFELHMDPLGGGDICF